MGKLLAIVVPLALGAAVTPTIIGAQLVTLTGRTRPIARAWALGAGCVVVLLIVSGLALVLASSTGGSDSPSRAGAIVKLVAALLLVVIGVRALRKRGAAQPAASPHPDERPRLARSFALGAGLMATNFSSLVLYFPAMHEIGISDAGSEAQIVAFVLLFSITLLPAVAPPLVVGALGERARRPLDAMSRFFTTHRLVIAAALCFTFAALLTVVGLEALV